MTGHATHTRVRHARIGVVLTWAELQALNEVVFNHEKADDRHYAIAASFVIRARATHQAIETGSVPNV
jgi:hypothetical protein